MKTINKKQTAFFQFSKIKRPFKHRKRFERKKEKSCAKKEKKIIRLPLEFF